MRRLIPDPGSTSVDEQLDSYRPWEQPQAERPFLATNFAVTVDGRASIEGRSGPIGSALDTEMLAGLRTRFDALMIGAGTMRVERYGRVIADRAKRERREQLGLPHDPLMVIVSGRLDLPWDAPLFTAGGGRVLIFTASEVEPPETATSVGVVRHEGAVDLSAAMRHLREEGGVRALLCEGGPHLHSQLWAAGLVDELFLTTAPQMTGAEAPRILEGAELQARTELELAWLLEHDGELFARYRQSRGR
ncbi:MAG TPA: dihydrofolate reductase family protein [Solirubrobacterales bacterium]|nr:dihydrofolate reductase family protein [Solirubrobacterales bacterium]